MNRQPLSRVQHWFALDKAIDRIHKKKAPAEAGEIKGHHDEFLDPIIDKTTRENNHHDERD